VLIKKFGCRGTQVFGGACILAGIALSALSRQLWHAVILYSVLAGHLRKAYIYNHELFYAQFSAEHEI